MLLAGSVRVHRGVVHQRMMLRGRVPSLLLIVTLLPLPLLPMLPMLPLLPLLPLLRRRRRRLVVSVVAAVLRRVLATVLPANLVVTRVRWHLGLGLRRERVHVSLLLLVILRLLRRRLLKRRLCRKRLELGVGVIKLVEERHVVTRVVPLLL